MLKASKNILEFSWEFYQTRGAQSISNQFDHKMGTKDFLNAPNHPIHIYSTINNNNSANAYKYLTPMFKKLLHIIPSSFSNITQFYEQIYHIKIVRVRETYWLFFYNEDQELRNWFDTSQEESKIFGPFILFFLTVSILSLFCVIKYLKAEWSVCTITIRQDNRSENFQMKTPPQESPFQPLCSSSEYHSGPY